MPPLRPTHTVVSRKSGVLLRLLTGLGFLLAFLQGHAGHSSGVELTYECVNGCTIRVHFKGFRDCSSSIPNLPPQNTVYFAADTGCAAPVLIGAWNNVSNTEITPACASVNTLCNSPSGTLNGITEHHWTADYDFCNVNCNEYQLSWGICCRNQSINTLYNAQTTGIFASTTVLPFSTPCNSSPTFDYGPASYLCAGNAYSLSQAATDPDGDSLAYRLGPCLMDSATSVPYLNWISPQSPLGPDWSVALDSLTGLLSIAPNPSGPNPGSQQVGIVCIYVEEWRNGVLLNTIQRDMQVSLLACSPNAQPTIPGALNPTGGTANGFQVSTCVGASVCFYVRAMDQDPGQTQTLIWDQSLASQGATFVLAGNPSVADTVSGSNPTAQFCWTPPLSGTYQFNVQISDDACPLNGVNQYTYTIHVNQNEAVSLDSALGCEDGSFCALPLSGFPPYTFQWNGAGGINQTDSCFLQTLPGPGTYPYQLVVTDSLGCKALVADTLVLTNNVVADAGTTHTVCANQPDTLGGLPDANPNLVYLWSPGLLLNDSTLSNPVFVGTNSGNATTTQTFVLLVQDTLTGCSFLDSVDVLVKPSPVADFAMPDQACLNSPTTISYAGASNPNTTFQWNFGVNATPTYATSPGPHQVSWAIPGSYEVSLTVEQGGCTSPTFRDTILIRDLPTVAIDPVADQCFAGHSLDFTGQGSYDSTAILHWDFGPSGNPNLALGDTVQGVTFDSSGTQLILLQVEESGCYSKTDSLFLELYPAPDATFSLGGNGPCLDGGNSLFTANDTSPGASYAWTFQDGMPAASFLDSVGVTFSSSGPKAISLTVTYNGCTSSLTDTLAITPNPVAVAGNDTSFCAGSNGVELQGTATNGTAPYHWQWSWDPNQVVTVTMDSSDIQQPQTNANGSAWVFLQVTDSNGCQSNTDSLWLDVLARPSVAAAGDSSLCADDTGCIPLSGTVTGGSGSYSYQWFPAAGLNDSSLLAPCAMPDSSTLYSLVATDLATGCSSDLGGIDSSAQAAILVHPVPQLEAGPSQSICPGDSVQLAAAAWGAGPNYVFNWTPGSGLNSTTIPDPVATPSFTTFYFLQVTSNGCTSKMDTLRVQVYPLPIADAGQDNEICYGESIQLGASAAGDPNAIYTYNWTNNPSLDDPQVQTPMATPANTTTYYVQVTTDYGCISNFDSVTVHLRSTPVAEAGDSAYVCLGDSLTLQGSFFFAPADSTGDSSQTLFTWSPATNLTDPQNLQPGLLPDSSGWYYLDAQYLTCKTRDSVYVTSVSTLFPDVQAEAQGLCEGDSILLEASGGYGNATFTWIPSLGLNQNTGAQVLASPASGTTYTVLVEEHGCRDSSQIRVEVYPQPEANLSHTDAAGCAPHQVFFASQSQMATAHLWNFGDGSPVQNLSEVDHEFNSPGDYQVVLTVVSDHGCVDTATVQVAALTGPMLSVNTYPLLPAELVLPQAEVKLEETGGEASQWNWVFPDESQLGGQSVSFPFEEPGTHYVRLRATNSEGCPSEMLVGPFVVVAPDLDIPNVFSPNQDGINDRFLVNYTGQEPFLLQIFDRWGTLHYEGRDKMEGWDGRSDSGASLGEGTYYYVLAIGKRKYNGHLTLVR